MADPSLPELVSLWHIDRESPYRAMLLDFLERHAQCLASELPQLATAQAAQERAGALRSCLLHSLGLTTWPERRPLDVKVTGELERADYIIQKITYEARPGFPVSAHLYLPRHTVLPAPAVLYSPGHWMENCLLEPDIQQCCGNLARLGLITLVYEPMGQGERFGDWLDHGHLEPLLVGYCQEGLMVWESMRAIDYLLSRPDVDPGRIGMTGASGGGLNTLYTSAVDERLHVSVPVCYVTTFAQSMMAERNRNWEDGVDLCNQVPGVMAYAEMSDILGLFAPRPLCIIASIQDWMFPIAGARQVAADVQRLYTLQGASDRVQLAEVDSAHGYDQKMREVAYGWLLRWLSGQGDGSPVPEIPCELLAVAYHPALTYIAPPDPADLPVLRQRGSFPRPSQGCCFADGAVPQPGPAITELVRQAAAPLPPAQDDPSGPEEWRRWRQDLMERVGRILGPFPDRPPVKDAIFCQVLDRGRFVERIVFESEPGIQIPAIFAVPAAWDQYVPVVIYVDEWGKNAGLGNGVIETLLQAGLAALAIDVRGVGETAATDFEAATNSLMMDRPLFGQRVYDVLRAVDCLWRRIYATVQIDKGHIACLGRGAGGLLALYAAALDERIAAAVAWEAPVSYKSLIAERPGFPPSTYLFDVLNHYDLPALMVAVAPRPLLLAGPVDGTRRALPVVEQERYLAWPSRAYALHRAAGQFETWDGLAGDATPGRIAGWLRHQLGSLGLPGPS